VESIARPRLVAAFLVVGALALAVGLRLVTADQPAAGGILPSLAAPPTEDTSPAPGTGGKVGKRRSTEPIGPGETPGLPAEGMTTFTNPHDGYRLRVPATWRSHPSRSEGAPPATTFQLPTASGSGARFGMTISVGSTDGWITLCGTRCATVRARSLDELARSLVPAFDSYSRDEVRHIDLGGEQGRLEVPKSLALPHYCLPEFMYDVYAFHGTRPVVLRIGYCVTRPGGTPEPGLPSDLVTQMIESFEFLD
jgi:hypothetical protein